MKVFKFDEDVFGLERPGVDRQLFTQMELGGILHLEGCKPFQIADIFQVLDVTYANAVELAPQGRVTLMRENSKKGNRAGLLKADEFIEGAVT